ncbi:MAG TPA: hypothetical protein VGK54_05090, partial [Chloroflexota bacterium]
KYGPDGQCIEQPAEPESFCNRIKIKGYPVQEYLGLVFAYLGDGAGRPRDPTLRGAAGEGRQIEPPPMWRFPDFEAEGQVDSRTTPVWPCNFFNRIDNDPVHVSFVHRDGPYQRGIPQIRCEESDSGIIIYDTFPDGSTSRTLHHMPNVSHFTARPRVMLEGGASVTGFRQSLGFRIPVDDEHHKVLSVDHVRVTGDLARSYEQGLEDLGRWEGPDLEALGEAVLRGEFHSDDIEDRRNITQVQDYVALVGQGVIADHANEHLGASDRSVILFRQLWMRELRALHEGRPLKQWTGAGDMSVQREVD